MPVTIKKLSLGKFNIYGLREGFFSLDGGAMFGVVPKTLWTKKTPSDDLNRIKIALNSLLIDNGVDLILVETGIGNKFNNKFSDIYSIEIKPGLIPLLNEIGIKPEDINYVINTHLHFDHCGGNTRLNSQGEIVPSFPHAKYIIQKKEWKHALQPNERDKASYLKENFLPLEQFGVVDLIEGQKKISKGVEVIKIPGHTENHQCVKIKTSEDVVFFLGDLVPTSSHIGIPYIMSYDLFPLKTLENKKKVFDQSIKEDWILAFNHDARYFFGKIRKEGEKYKFKPLD